MHNSGFHGEFGSSDARAVTLTETTARIALYNQYGTQISTLQSDEQVVITQMQINTTADQTVTIYDGANATVSAGEIIYKGVCSGTNLAIGFVLKTPHYCQAGYFPKVVTDAAFRVDVQIHGYIVKAIR